MSQTRTEGFTQHDLRLGHVRPKLCKVDREAFCVFFKDNPLSVQDKIRQHLGFSKLFLWCCFDLISTLLLVGFWRGGLFPAAVVFDTTVDSTGNHSSSLVSL